MDRNALTGIGQIIKANTTEKSIDQLRAEGKKRVRVVSSDRVMAIIQAIVDDTIASEVGEITKRDRDRIVSDTQARFSRVLKMQQDLEQQVDDLRGARHAAELERDRLRSEKGALESQLAVARRDDGEADAVSRFGRELARVREAVERSPRDAGTVDEAALGRMAEKLAARDAQTARRIATEFDDLRLRLDAVARDSASARDTTTEKVLQRVKEQQSLAEAQFVARLDRDFRAVTDHLAAIRTEVGRGKASGDDVTRLRDNLDALENRVHGFERASADVAERVSKAVMDRIEAHGTAVGGRAGAALDAAEVAEALRRLQHAGDEGRENLLAELGGLRESMADARTLALSIQAEQHRDLAQRITEGAGRGTEDLLQSVERLADRTSALDASLRNMSSELAGAVERAATGAATTPAALTEALDDLRDHSERVAASAARTAETQAAVVARLDCSLTELRGEFMALTARSIEAAERQHEAVLALREQIALSTAVQSDALQSTFKGALDQALDKIERTMERATARPIEMTGEATEVLLAKIFDAPAGEVTSNLGQLDVEERRTKGTIANSIDRLKRMGSPAKSQNEQPV